MGFFRRSAPSPEIDEPEDDGAWGRSGVFFDATHASDAWYQSVIDRIARRKENAVINTRGGRLEIYAHGHYFGSTSDGIEAEKMFCRAVGEQ